MSATLQQNINYNLANIPKNYQNNAQFFTFNRCQFPKKNGQGLCTRPAVIGSIYCRQHSNIVRELNGLRRSFGPYPLRNVQNVFPEYHSNESNILPIILKELIQLCNNKHNKLGKCTNKKCKNKKCRRKSHRPSKFEKLIKIILSKNQRMSTPFGFNNIMQVQNSIPRKINSTQPPLEQYQPTLNDADIKKYINEKYDFKSSEVAKEEYQTLCNDDNYKKLNIDDKHRVIKILANVINSLDSNIPVDYLINSEKHVICELLEKMLGLSVTLEQIKQHKSDQKSAKRDEKYHKQQQLKKTSSINF